MRALTGPVSTTLCERSIDMNEREWVETFAPKLNDEIRAADASLSVVTGEKLPYAREIHHYHDSGDIKTSSMKYETDILLIERDSKECWIPRVIVETKCRGSISTHDAITYSHKAFTHRQVHPYLRYGILVAERGHFPLPGRLFRHGTQFDFMLSWKGNKPTTNELKDFVEIALKEVDASRIMQEIIFESRKKGRKHYSVLHKELKVK